MPLRITLNDVARAAGVSKSTVARALANDPRISAGTKNRVVTKAESMGYRPDPMLRVLSAHRWGKLPPGHGMTIACVNLTVPGRAMPKSAYMRPMTARAEALGYRLEEFEIGDYGSGARLSSVLYSRGIRGVLVTPIITTHPPVDIDWRHFTAVSCGVGEVRLPIHSVDTSYFSAVRLAWRECIRRGYRRIGAAFYRQDGPDNNDALRHSAYYYEREQDPRTHGRIPIFSGALGDRSGFMRWFERHRPEVVVSLNETAYWWLHDAGYRVPADVGYCGLSKPRVPEPGESPRISGVMPLRERVAVAAVNWLDQLIRLNETGLPEVPDEILIEPAWYEGETLQALPVG
jgi:DNA-binding LacI/PurR family transcriptional regulator